MTKRVLLAYTVLAVVTAFFPVLSGELPVPTDCGLLLLPGHAPPRGGNVELWDVPTAFLPWTRAVSDAYRHARLPLRFAANGCGTPLWANPQAQALTPTTWVTWVLPEAWALAVSAAIRLWLAAAGAFLLFRRRGLSDGASAAAGLAYGFSLAFTTWLHYPLTYPQAILPWLALALERLALREAGGLSAATAAIAALLLGGYPEGELLAAAAGLVFFAAVVARSKARRTRAYGRLAGAAALALGLTAAAWLPQARAILGSERSARVDRATPARVPAPRLAEILRPPLYADTLRYWVVPEAKGNPRDGDKVGPYSFAGRASGYAGILVLAFALATFAWRRASAAVSFARIALVLLTLYVLWFPPLRWVLDALPGIREVTRRLTSGRPFFLTVFLLALLAAFQLDRLRRGAGRTAGLWAAALALLATLAVLGESLRDPAHPAWSPVRSARFLVPAILLIGTLAILRRPLTARRMRALTAFFLLGTAVDLLRIGVRFNPGTPPKDYFPVTPAVQRLRTASAGGRFATDTSALSGMAHMYGLEDLGAQDPMAPARYVDALRAGAGYDAPERPLGNVRRLDAPLLDFLNVRARLSQGDAIRAVTTPPAVLPDRLIGCRDDAALLDRLSRETDLVSAALAVGGDETFSGRAEIVSLERPAPERIRIRVRSDAARALILPESDDGGWSAEAGGRPLPTFRSNGAFLGIRVPAGETEIVCRYVPPGFRAGLAMSALAAALAAGLVIGRASPKGPRLLGSVG